MLGSYTRVFTVLSCSPQSLKAVFFSALELVLSGNLRVGTKKEGLEDLIQLNTAGFCAGM